MIDFFFINWSIIGDFFVDKQSTISQWTVESARSFWMRSFLGLEFLMNWLIVNKSTGVWGLVAAKSIRCSNLCGAATLDPEPSRGLIVINSWTPRHSWGEMIHWGENPGVHSSAGGETPAASRSPIPSSLLARSSCNPKIPHNSTSCSAVHPSLTQQPPSWQALTLKRVPSPSQELALTQEPPSHAPVLALALKREHRTSWALVLQAFRETQEPASCAPARR